MVDILDDLPWGGLRIDKAGHESVCQLVSEEREELANLPVLSRDEALTLLGIDGRISE